MGAGFKYVLATGIISGFLLIGIIFTYYYTGSLNIDDIANAKVYMHGGSIAIFMILIAAVLEMKPFPANGWGLDVYEGSDPGLAAIISAATATAAYFVLYKIMSIAGPEWSFYISLIGAVTFVGSNLLGLKQENTRRMLGYSSLGQIGLLMIILGFKDVLGTQTPYVVFGILISHYFAKAGLFWLSGIVKSKSLKGWAVIRKKPFFLFLMGTFVFALIGFPPFPSFFAKWTLVMELVNTGNIVWVAVILFGSILEAVYLFRWFGQAIKEENENLEDFEIKLHKIIPVWLVAIALYVVGYFTAQHTQVGAGINFIPLLFVGVLFALDFLPVFVKNTVAIVGMAYYFCITYPNLDNLRLVFEAIFLIGGILALIAGYAYKGKRSGFYPVAILMYAGLTAIIEANTTLQFFYGWELMTAGSYFLIIRGKRSMPHGLSYMLFSIGGAYAILAAFGIAHHGQTSFDLSIINNIQYIPVWAYGLLIVGFLTKTASVGLHIWLPGAHGEAESDVSPMVSAILLKAGVFGLVIALIGMGSEANPYSALTYALGWIGAITIVAGNLMAVFQEDAKRLLAYSSIGQLGYIVLGLAMMTHMGWLGGFSYVVNHFLYKAVLFMTIGAVVMRVGTHNMYEMGGLIKRMPMAFLAVMIGIIALSGVPPLSGFAGKWLFYNAIIEKGWYFQGVLSFISSGIAFLYLWRLIHTIFLGQLKDNHRNVKDISIWFAIPIYTLIVGIMIYSFKPKLVLQPLGEIISKYFPSNPLLWDGATAFTQYGHWAGSLVGITIGVSFIVILIMLLISTRKAHKVEQFDITYSGERPERPETTHVAYNVFEGLYKAVWPATIPLVATFWGKITDLLHDLAGFTRRMYSGNGQSYMLHILFFIIITYLVIIGG
jgi:formate hydrogenlyase subunit 3/multisubunit Na+/H+ antiporter MnhD subunit